MPLKEELDAIFLVVFFTCAYAFVNAFNKPSINFFFISICYSQMHFEFIFSFIFSIPYINKLFSQPASIKHTRTQIYKFLPFVSLVHESCIQMHSWKIKVCSMVLRKKQAYFLVIFEKSNPLLFDLSIKFM